MKFGRNDPCWCGSGIKYKKCHLEREKATPLQQWEIEQKLRSSFADKICLHPSPGKDCGKKIIKAHTVQKNGGLNCIAKDGHVLSFQINFEMLNSGNIVPAKIGINRASTFTGFCNIHDNATFEPIEKNEITFTDEQIFLFGYRALCREYYQKMGHLKTLGHIKELDKGRQFIDQVYMNKYADALSTGVNAGFRDLTEYKKFFDNKLVRKDYGKMGHCIIELNKSPSIMCTSGFNLEFDFDGNVLQSLEDPKTKMDLMTCSLIGYSDKGAIVFVWPEDCIYSRMLIDSLLKCSPDAIPNAVARLVFEFSENVFFSESWWEGSSKVVRDDLSKRVLSGASGLIPRNPNCLIDNGINYVNWEVKAISHNLN